MENLASDEKASSPTPVVETATTNATVATEQPVVEQSTTEQQVTTPDPVVESKPKEQLLRNKTEEEEIAEIINEKEPEKEAPVRQVANGNGNGNGLAMVKALTAKVNNAEGAEVSVIDLLKDDEKAMIKGVSSDGKKVIFNSDDVSSCPYCKEAQPMLIGSYCIFCGKKF